MTTKKEIKNNNTKVNESLVEWDDEDDEDTLANKYLCFKLSNEEYGIAIRHIIEIIELQKITEVPDMPGFVRGVINLRGKVIPVIDLRLRFHILEREYDDRTCIIVIHIDETLIGLIVDTVDEVLLISGDNIEEAPKFSSTSTKDRYVEGLAKVGETVKIILDVEKILYEKDLSVLKEEMSEV